MIYRPILLTAAMAWALSVLGPYLDGVTLDDHGAEVQQAKDLEDAQREAEIRYRFEQAARHLCGPQSAWREVSQGVIECAARRGLPLVRLSIKDAP